MSTKKKKSKNTTWANVLSIVETLMAVQGQLADQFKKAAEEVEQKKKAERSEKRFWLASSAMNGMLVRHSMAPTESVSTTELSRRAFDVADEMLKEHEARKANDAKDLA